MAITVGATTSSPNPLTTSSTSSKKTQTPATSTNKIDPPVKEQAASATAAEVSQAAYTKVSQRMNVGDTGFGKGTEAFVASAVQKGLTAQAARKSGPSGDAAPAKQAPAAPEASTYAPKTNVDNYQSGLIAQSNSQKAKQAAPPKAQSSEPMPPAVSKEAAPSEETPQMKNEKKVKEESKPKERENYQTQQMKANRDRQAAEEAAMAKKEAPKESEQASTQVQPRLESIA